MAMDCDIIGSLDSMVRVPLDSLNRRQREFYREEYTVGTADGDFALWREENGELLLPWSARKAFAPTLRDARVAGEPMNKATLAGHTFSPREGQEEALVDLYSTFTRKDRMRGGGNLIAPCGAGKTVVGAELALRLGRRTVVLVHKEFLARQWEKAFRMLAPDVRIGRVQKERCEYEGMDVVIVMCQSLVGKTTKRVYPAEFFSSAGVVICDEVHRYGAEVWQAAIVLFPAAIRLGLTATFRRKDGMLAVIEEHIGGVLHTMEVETQDVRVHFVKLGTKIDSAVFTMPYKGKWGSNMNRGKLISALAENTKRSEVIVRSVVKAMGADRKVFVLSERRKHLDTMANMAIKAGVDIDNVGFFVGGKDEDELDVESAKGLIFGTYQMASEGLDIPSIDTLFLATPMADVQQSVGRIVRPSADKKEPVVVDYVDRNIGPCAGFAVARRNQYEALGYEIP